MAGDREVNRAVVSGAAGFLGRCIVKNLLGRGTEVLGIDPKPFDAGEIPYEDAGHYRHEVSDLEDASGAACRFLMEVPRLRRTFYHIAGISDASLCKEDPLLAFQANVTLTVKALQCCREAGGAVFVFPSSGLVYGDALQGSANEDDAVTCSSVYGATKLAAESLVGAYASNYACPAIIARLSNVYGPGSGDRTVIGRILGQARARSPLRVFDERPMRDFIFSEDAAEGLVRLASAAIDGKCFTINLSTATAVSIGEVVETAAQLTNSSRLSPEQGNLPGGSPSRLVLSNRRLKELTGWTPQTTLTEGLQKSLMRW